MGNLLVQEVSVTYETTPALKKISIEIPEKQVTALIGPSGCGKSTFLRCFNRMNEELPDCTTEGTILWNGVDILSDQMDPVFLRTQIGMVFQRPNPFPVSIFDNIAYGPRLQGIRRKKELKEIVEQCLHDAGLHEEVKDRIHKSAFALSGGQQQRLCIARALASQPQVILMDEPCSALDPISTARIEDLINRLKADYTVIIVTHNMQEAARVSDSTGFLYLGELIEWGKTRQIFENPVKQLTENYITGKFG